MRFNVAIVCAGLAALGSADCNKGGGGGGWLVGTEGMMANVGDDGRLGEGYDLGATETLNAIACRYDAEAWVVGAHGTVLYTRDGGASWETQDIGTTANLRALATQDGGSVFVAGDGVFMTATPSYTTGQAEWTQLGDGVTKFTSVAAAQRGTTVLAVSDDGGIWRFANGQLTRQTTLAGARSVALSLDGQTAFVAGDGLWRSNVATEGTEGTTWSSVAADPASKYSAIRIDETGDAVAVGDGGIVSRIATNGQVLTQHVGTADLKTIHIAPSDDYTGTGYAAGVGGQIWITQDSGWTWNQGPNVGRTVLGADEIGLGHN